MRFLLLSSLGVLGGGGQPQMQGSLPMLRGAPATITGPGAGGGGGGGGLTVLFCSNALEHPEWLDARAHLRVPSPILEQQGS